MPSRKVDMGRRRGRYSLTYGRNRQTATAKAGKRRMNGQAPYWLKGEPKAKERDGEAVQKPEEAKQ